jgi:Domain of unknown function (DUF4365)
MKGASGHAQGRCVMAGRKRRVRSHIIADMSVHHLAYHVVKSGFTLEVVTKDYGFDAWIQTFDANGEIENGQMYVQLKATDQIDRKRAGTAVEYRVRKKDLDLWEGAVFPVYLVLFDAAGELAYWVYLQRYLQANRIKAAHLTTASLVVEIDVNQVLDAPAVRSWREDKASVIVQIGKIDHA